MLDDRMTTENLKEVASALMGQQEAGHTPTHQGQPREVRPNHPDRAFAESLFGADTASDQSSGIDWGPLRSAVSEGVSGASRSQPLHEDLVQQAAQALVKDNVDAFLAITQRMNPDEIQMTLQTARQWRRADPDWQDAFRSAPETGFKFMDRDAKNQVKGGGSATNKAEALALTIVNYMRENQIDPADSPYVVRQVLKQRGIRLPERQLVKFANRVTNLL